MIEAGMPVDETLRMSARASGNAVMQDRLLEGLAAVEDGRPPSEGFRRLPPDFLAVWQTGEETGGFSVAAARLAEERAERARFRFKLGATWFARGLYFLILLAGAYMVVRMGMDLVGKISELGVLP
jgi:general secretion pathway protein F/type IV pilus assembly protein PilC